MLPLVGCSTQSIRYNKRESLVETQMRDASGASGSKWSDDACVKSHANDRKQFFDSINIALTPLPPNPISQYYII